jgi:indolepyruvate ferredoxin oxidoreductase alpha subunit
MAVLPTGFSTLKTLHAMGSGVGLASGFGKLGQFGMNQPVLATVGDSTFFHAVLPALVNAVHHQSDVTIVVLDNGGTAMTGFQSHPGLPVDAAGNDVPAIDVAAVCQAMGATVRISDPFDIDNTQQTLLELFEIKGLKVLVLQQMCALSPQKKGKKMFDVSVDENICLGQNCGCNQLCTRIFKCPGLKWNPEQQVSGIDEVICVGCGVCASICPSGAIQRKEVA